MMSILLEQRRVNEHQHRIYSKFGKDKNEWMCVILEKTHCLFKSSYPPPYFTHVFSVINPRKSQNVQKENASYLIPIMYIASFNLCSVIRDAHSNV